MGHKDVLTWEEELWTGHRSSTHSPWLPLLWGLICQWVGPDIKVGVAKTIGGGAG